ncbi:MAG: ATP-binding protein [Candidatus Liptonbacteria bacterium]|nr:ATP-binding protein [Candidatus Liptonbacteria bacterium]
MDEKQIKNIIAPSAIKISPNSVKIGDKYLKTLFIFSFPRYLSSGWLNPIINLPELLDMSIFVHPVDTSIALKNLMKKAAQLEAEIMEHQESGLVRDPALETAYKDIDSLRDALQQAREKLFNVGLYVTIYADTAENLNKLEAKITSMFENKLVYIKNAVFQQGEGYTSILPLGEDKLRIYTPLNSGPLSSFFPFISTDLTSNKGVMYGLNRHNSTLIIFDRFSLENANTVIFSKSGAGKSYAAKLEILRMLMTGVDVLIVDPENEYETLTRSVGGTVFKIGLLSKDHINPLDIPPVPEDENPGEVLKSHTLNLAGLLKLMLGKIKPEEDALLDQAITEVYAARGITAGKDFGGIEPPRLQDLRIVLENMQGGRDLAQRLYRFTDGSFAGFVNQPTNINVSNRLIAFSIRDLEPELRPIAIYIILNFIWNMIRSKLKKRIIVLDEAWWMMKIEEGAQFLFGLVKRARKYYLGVTTITQDVEDFINSPYGKPIITNSSLQLLLQQAPAAIDVVAKTFALTETEKNLLIEAEVGHGIFFAGLKHVAIQIIPSFFENKIITTNPEEILQMRKET